MKLRILAVCPYEALCDMVQTVASQRNDIDADTILGDISDGESLLDRVRAIQSGYDLLISRGQTLQFLKKVVDIPILEIPTGPFDIMRIVRLIKDFPGKCVIVGTSNIQTISRQICELMETRVDTVASDDNDNIYQALQKLRDDGYTLVVGGVTGTRMARALGMNSLLIPSGREAVCEVLDRAVFLHEQLRRSQLDVRLLKNLIDGERCFSIVFDEARRVVFQSANVYALPPSSIEKKLDALFQCGELSTHLRIGGEAYIFSGKTCEADGRRYALIRISPCYYIDPKKQTWISAQSAAEQAKPISIVLNTKSPALLRELEHLKTCALSRRPVVVSGETGVGKEEIVRRLHALSEKRDGDLIAVDVSRGTKKSWEALLNHPNSPLNRMDCNIFFKNIQEIPEYACDPFEEYIASIAAGDRVRLYFSWTESAERPMEAARFWRVLSERANALCVRMPPLRERKEDFPNLIALMISECNVQLGTQVFGIEEPALRRLTEYAWPYNFPQFQQLIRDAVVRTFASRISEEVVQDLLSRLPRVLGEHGSDAIDLNRTLAEINDEIIQRVLREENYNASRTAARLGISRSSLWRKARKQ